MPLNPINSSVLLPTETEDDVRRVFEKARSLSGDLGGYVPERYALADHFFYIGAICPEHFRPLQEETVNLTESELNNFWLEPETWLYLMQSATDLCVETLERRLSEESGCNTQMTLLRMLAGILSPAALEALANVTRKGDLMKIVSAMGFYVPRTGAAVPRFSTHRLAIECSTTDYVSERSQLSQKQHPVGLPIESIFPNDAYDQVWWHYLTLDLGEVPGLPPLPAPRLHFVSPLNDSCWVLYYNFQNASQGRVVSISYEEDTEEVLELWRTHLEPIAAETDKDPISWQWAELLPFDDQRTYWHQLVSYGRVGGPPISLVDQTPRSPHTGKPMFFVAVVSSNIRSFGAGLRNLYVCEDSGVVACLGTAWN